MPLPEPNAIVVGRVDICEHMMILRVAPSGWELPDFQSGQYAMVGLPNSAPKNPDHGTAADQSSQQKLLTRSYSVASMPSEREYLEFFMTLVPDGALSPRMFALKVGDRLWISKTLTGFFTLERVPLDSNILILATGSGLSACMGIVRSAVAANRNRRIAVVHGSRFSRELAYRDELEMLARVRPNFSYFNCISRPEAEVSEWRGRTGYIQDILRSNAIDKAWGFHWSPVDTHIFVSGNPAMCDAVSNIVTEQGFTEQTYKTDGTLHLEKFW